MTPSSEVPFDPEEPTPSYEVNFDDHDEPSVPARGGDRRAREVGVRELKHSTSEVIDRVAGGERVVVTRRGRLVAVILSLDESLEFVLAYGDEFTRARQSAREHRGRRVRHEVRFSPAAARGLADAQGNRRRLRWLTRMLASRAAIHAPALQARSARGTLAEPGPIADGRAIQWVRHRDGGLFVVRAGWNRAACDVLPERMPVMVFAVTDTRRRWRRRSKSTATASSTRSSARGRRRGWRGPSRDRPPTT